MNEQPLNAVKTPEREQLELEQFCRNEGSKRILAGQWHKAAEGALMNKLAAPYLEMVVESWKNGIKRPGRQSHVWSLITSQKDLEQVALESLCYVLGVLNDSAYGNGLARVLGKRAEYVLWMCHPQWGKSKHLQGLKLASGSDLGMELMTKRLRDKGFKKAAEYEPLKPIERCGLGWVFIECIERTTGLIESYVATEAQGRKKRRVRGTMLYWEFLSRYREMLRWLRPVKLPMIVAPVPWTGHHTGGYLSIETQFSPIPYEEWEKCFGRALPCVLGSTNALQAQRFQLDPEMLAFLEDVWNRGYSIGKVPPRKMLDRPLDSEFKMKGLGPSAFWKATWEYKADQRKNVSRSQIIGALATAARLDSAGAIHFVNKQDHRGRDYTYGGQIHPQASEHFRALIRFDQRSPMKGHEAAFAWSLGEAFGCKPDERERLDFLFEERADIYAAGQDPMAMLEYIDRAKEPFRFAQLCMDWSAYCDDETYETGTIHWLDQTCSGWGHVACLIEDGDLAQYTNITGSKPADLYVGIGLIVERHLSSKIRLKEGNETDRKCMEWWLGHKPPRELYKKMFMPVIYGRTYLTLVETVRIYLREEVNDFLVEDGLRIVDLANVMAKAAHSTLKQMFPKIGKLSTWLGDIAAAQIKAGIRPHWMTPNRLLVQSYCNKTERDYIRINVSNKNIKVQHRDQDKSVFNVGRSRRKLVPDFIHSMDAAFLQRFVYHWDQTYGHPLSTVHDCFGTTLEHVSMMRVELNDQWARFYSEDHLARHKGASEISLQKKLPNPPMVATLDKERMGENRYLFC